MARDRMQMAKGLVLMAAAVAALGAGIHKGGEAIFFGIVIGLVCGFIGFFFVRGEEGPRGARKAKRR